jgi:uncharacterized repeat protein (TIGR01451 family)
MRRLSSVKDSPKVKSVPKSFRHILHKGVEQNVSGQGVSYWRSSLTLSLITSVFSLGCLSLIGTSGSQALAEIPAGTQSEDVTKVFQNTAAYTYRDPASSSRFEGNTNPLTLQNRLIDPLGRILGCNGQELPNYLGFSVALYNPDPTDSTGAELGSLVDLTPTEFPDIEGNGVSRGLEPNILNSNPFFLRSFDRGRYNFLFDPNKGQTLPPGRSYILVVNPPTNSIYVQRRVKITIADSTGSEGNNVIRYTAQSLDGQPIKSNGGQQVSERVVFVPNAETVGLDLLSLQFTTGMCQPDQIDITKTADRATAEPGDIIIYRLTLRSKSDAALQGIQVSDQLPRGFKYVPGSVRAELKGEPVAMTATNSKTNILFTSAANIPTSEVMTIAYAVQVTPDALRGNGRNSAIVNANRTDNGFAIKDGPASHDMKIRPGLASDAGTLIGRVFEDKNEDGEQQPGEPGIPNAVIFLQDGNRVVTDAKGLYSLQNVLPGNYSGTLDLSSIPGYQIAPNSNVRERNSQSRLVRLAPGGMARMNFAVLSFTDATRLQTQSQSAPQPTIPQPTIPQATIPQPTTLQPAIPQQSSLAPQTIPQSEIK